MTSDAFLTAGHFSNYNDDDDMIIPQVRKLNCDIYSVKAMLLKVSCKKKKDFLK